MARKTGARLSAAELTYIPLFTVLIAVCSWISIPMAVPFTMQTFAIFAAVGLLGGKRATLSVLLYIFIGALGVPVFSNFGGGIGVLLGPTGGYIVGFVLSTLVGWFIRSKFGAGLASLAAAMALGLTLCYAFGTAWFMVVYARASGPVSLATALGWCVTPFIVPDLIKIALALVVTRRLARRVHLA